MSQRDRRSPCQPSKRGPAERAARLVQLVFRIPLVWLVARTPLRAEELAKRTVRLRSSDLGIRGGQGRRQEWLRRRIGTRGRLPVQCTTSRLVFAELALSAGPCGPQPPLVPPRGRPFRPLLIAGGSFTPSKVVWGGWGVGLSPSTAQLDRGYLMAHFLSGNGAQSSPLLGSVWFGPHGAQPWPTMRSSTRPDSRRPHC